MKRSIYIILFMVFSLSIFVYSGCSSSKQSVREGTTYSENQGSKDDYDEIEKLLGISNDDSLAKKKGMSKQDDDLIKLLEADEGKKKEVTPGQELDQEQKRMARIENEAEQIRKQLRKKLQEKDLKIADLKAKLLAKEEELQKYRSGGSTGSSRAGVFSGSMSTPRANALTRHGAPDDYVAKYQRGLDLFHQRKYRDALAVFEALLATDTNNDYSDNAQYWIGECYFAMGRYKEAILAFEKVFTFRYSNKNDYAQFKIGQCYFMLGDKQRARQEFQQFIDNYQKSELIPRAQGYLAQL